MHPGLGGWSLSGGRGDFSLELHNLTNVHLQLADTASAQLEPDACAKMITAATNHFPSIRDAPSGLSMAPLSFVLDCCGRFQEDNFGGRKNRRGVFTREVFVLSDVILQLPPPPQQLNTGK